MLAAEDDALGGRRRWRAIAGNGRRRTALDSGWLTLLAFLHRHGVVLEMKVMKAVKVVKVMKVLKVNS